MCAALDCLVWSCAQFWEPSCWVMGHGKTKLVVLRPCFPLLINGVATNCNLHFCLPPLFGTWTHLAGQASVLFRVWFDACKILRGRRFQKLALFMKQGLKTTNLHFPWPTSQNHCCKTCIQKTWKPQKSIQSNLPELSRAPSLSGSEAQKCQVPWGEVPNTCILSGETSKNNLEQHKSSRYPGNPRYKKYKIPWRGFQLPAIVQTLRPRTYIFHGQPPNTTARICS